MADFVEQAERSEGGPLSPITGPRAATHGSESRARTVPVADSALLGARVIQLLRGLRAWSATLGSDFVPQVAEMAALSLASAAPASPPERLLPAAMSVVWAQTVDDRFDVTARTQQDVDQLVRRCREVAAGGTPAAEDPMEQALASLAAALRECPQGPALGDLWLRRLDLMLDSCRFEWTAGRTLALTGEAPTLERYLSHHHSVGFGMICVAWWMSCAGPEIHEHLDTLLAAVDQLERAVRLANDQQTAHRENSTEATGLNAAALGASREWIEQRLEHHLTAGHELLRPLERRLPQAVELGRVADWLVGLYRVTEARLQPTAAKG